MAIEEILAISNVVQESRQLMQRYGRESSDEEVAEQLGWTADKVKRAKIMAEELDNVLATLHDGEQEMLRMRFGLDDGHALTREEVVLAFDVTRETIREIEAKVFRRLRHPKRVQRLKGCLDT